MEVIPSQSLVIALNRAVQTVKRQVQDKAWPFPPSP